MDANDPKESALEEELALLAALVIGPGLGRLSATDRAWVYRTLRPADFGLPRHGEIFKLLLGMYDAGIDPDTLLLYREAKERNAVDRCGGPEYLARVAEAVTTPESICDYAEIVLRCADRRAAAARAYDQATHLRNLADRTQAGEDVASELAAALLEQEQAPRRAVRLSDLVMDLTPDAIQATPPARPMLFAVGDRGVLPRGIPATLAGPGSAGKSLLTMQAAISIATGRPLLDSWWPCSPCESVLLCYGEESADEVLRRLHRICRRLDLTEAEIEKVARYVVPVPLFGRDARLITPDGGDSATFVELRTFLHRSGRRWAMIAIDPMSMFADQMAETDNFAATEFVRRVQRLTEVPGNPTVLVSTHSGKQGSRSGGSNGIDSADPYMARGSSALIDGSRCCFNLIPGKDTIELLHVKSNYAARTKKLTLVNDGGFLKLSPPESTHDTEAHRPRKASLG